MVTANIFDHGKRKRSFGRDLHAKRVFSLRYDAISGIRGRITESAIARVATAKLETVWSCAPRVDTDSTIFGLDFGAMRVPRNDHVEPGRRRIQCDLFQIVHHVKRAAGEDDEFGLGIFLCPFTSIDVSFDSVGAIFRSPSITRQRQCPRRE